MKYRYITFILLLAGVLQTMAQALSDRYNRKRPVVIICDNSHSSLADHHDHPSGCCADIAKAVTERIGLPCKIVMQDIDEAQLIFKQGNADIILSDGRGLNAPTYFASKNVINYCRTSDDFIDETRFIGKDHQLIEQMDDEFTRMKEAGDIAAIQERWMNPEFVESEATPTALYIAIALLFVAFVFCGLILFLLAHTRRTHRNTIVLDGIISLAPQMEQFYAIEDNQAAHDLMHKYNAILCNPFVAISFYDNNGHLIIENQAMKELGNKDIALSRQPLYNAEGEITNYFVAIRRPVT
jgi:hypothetical protein